MSMEISDDEALLQIIENELIKFKELRAAVPSGWPRDRKYKITCSGLKAYAEKRQEKYWEQMNFPFLLYNLFGLRADKKFKPLEVYESMVELLDNFSNVCGHLPGAKRILEPLWNDAWSVEPRLWGVLSETALALFLGKGNFEIVGFDMEINSSKKTADIKAIWQKKIAWIDIEACSLTKEIDGDDDSVRKLIESRANKKMDKKFESVTDDQLGIVASIYRPGANNISKFKHQSEALKPVPGNRINILAHVYWLMTGRWGTDKHHLAMIDHSTFTTNLVVSEIADPE